MSRLGSPINCSLNEGVTNEVCELDWMERLQPSSASRKAFRLYG